MPQKDTSKKPTRKSADKNPDTNAPAELSVIEKLNAAIAESVSFFPERIAAGDDPSDAAQHVLTALYYRVNKIAPLNFHGRFGYDYDAAQIESNIRRIDQDLSRRSLEPAHGRIDTVLNDLVSEVMRLAQSQSIHCEQCEHCLSENGADLTERATKNTLDEKELAFVVERFNEFAGSDFTNDVIAALAHVDSMLYVERPGAARDVIKRLLDAMLAGSVNTTERREQYVATGISHVKKLMRFCEEEDREADR